MLDVLGPMSHLLTVEFDLPSHIDKADDQAVMDWFCGIYSSNGAPQRVAIHEVFQAMLFPDGKPAEPPRYLALVSRSFLAFAFILTDR